MITKILIGLTAIVVISLIVVALRPANFRVERSATLSASPTALFEHVNDHHKFAVWNPFLKLDPNVKNTYSGPACGRRRGVRLGRQQGRGRGKLHDHREQARRTGALPNGLETADGRHGDG